MRPRDVTGPAGRTGARRPLPGLRRTRPGGLRRLCSAVLGSVRRSRSVGSRTGCRRWSRPGPTPTRCGRCCWQPRSGTRSACCRCWVDAWPLAVARLVLDAEPVASLVLVPVPSAPAQVAARGVDLTASLAREAAVRLRPAGLGVRVHRGLALARRPEDQAGLDRTRRLVNLAGAFRAVGAHPVRPGGDRRRHRHHRGDPGRSVPRLPSRAERRVIGAAVVAATMRGGGAR